MAESDDQLSDVLKAQAHRAKQLDGRLTESEAQIAAINQQVREGQRFLEGRGIQLPPTEQATGEQSRSVPAPVGSWEELVEFNSSWLADAGLQDATLDDFLTNDQLNQLESFSALGRERWTVGDFVTVGGCAVIGVLATVFDDQIDLAVKSGLGGLSNTSLLKSWEANGKNLPIDYTGKNFGGAGHRVRSAGHDIGRPWEALSQIRHGEFRGVYWDHGEMFHFASQVTPKGKPYLTHGAGEALVLWLQHLAADLVTETSLPLPWWSKLYEIPNRDMRQLAHELYNPADGHGMNVRSMFMSKALPVLTTELVVGVKVHLDAYSLEGHITGLSANQKLRRNEMLLAGHAATGLASVGKTAVLAATSENAVALRHLNIPALTRMGWLAFRVGAEYRKRAKERVAPTWDDLLRSAPLPWQLDELAIVN